MKKLLGSILVLTILLVGCGKDSSTEKIDETIPVTEEVAVENSYFFNKEGKNNYYTVDFGFYNDYEKYTTNLEVSKIKTTEFGDVYNILIPLETDVPVANKNLGYFLVTNDLIVKLNSKEEVDNINETVTTENAQNIGLVVCSETDMDYNLGEGMEEVNYTITNSGEEIKFRSHSDYGAGSYVEFTWKKDVGLVHYELGDDAEGHYVKAELISNEGKKLEKTTNYVGSVDDIPIHMELSYYEDGTVVGSYYYDKYKEDIALIGTRENNVLKIKAEDSSEGFVGRVHSNYINGTWGNASGTLSFDLWNENNDEYSSDNDDYVAYGDYLYYTQSCNLYRLNLITGSRELIEYKPDVGWLDNLTIYKDTLYYTDGDGNVYKNWLDGTNEEIINIDYGTVDKEFMSVELDIYKGRIYAFITDFSIENEPKGYVVSTNLEGGDRKEFECPTIYDPEYSEHPLAFNLLFIYNDYIYFENSQPMGFEFTAYKMKVDGSDSNSINILEGSPIEINGAAGEYYFTGWAAQSFAIYKNLIDSEDGAKRQNIYTEDEIPETYNGAIVDVANNDKYIVNCLDDRNLDYYKVKVFDFDGNIINEVEIEKPTIPETDDYILQYFNFGIVDEYVYFSIYADGYVERMGRFKTTEKGGMVEQYDTLNDEYFLD